MSIYEPAPNEFLMENYGMTQSPNKVVERDFINAKAYTLTASEMSGMNLYDHLANVLTVILDERPENLRDVFEDYCNREKRTCFSYKLDTLLDKKPSSKEVQLAIAQKKQFKEVMKMIEAGTDQEGPIVPNLRYISFLLEQANLGIGKEEMVRIWVAIKVLSKTIFGAAKIRFWGKIFGLKHNYTVAEVEFTKDTVGDEGEFMDKTEDDWASVSTVGDGNPHRVLFHDMAEPKGPLYYVDGTAEHSVNEQVINFSIPKEVGDGVFNVDELVKKVKNEPKPPLPEPFYIKPPSVPREKPRMGINKKAYYVCSNPGEPWVKLPAVTPQHISAARMIKKFFTGILDTPIVSYPPFPGTEKNFLRAQIARISSGTHISPAGYFQLEEEEEEVEDEEGNESGTRGNLMENPEYEPLQVADLASSDLGNWVHHVQYILEQGRTKWWDPTQSLLEIKRQIKERDKLIKKKIREEDGTEGDQEEETEEEEEEAEEDEELDEPLEPEEGPPLLTPISEDQGFEDMPPWNVRLSSEYAPACAVLESNTWPGACAIGNQSVFENVYVGWGQKYTVESYQPAPPFDLQLEFMDDTDLVEIEDPTPAQEDAWAKTNMPSEEEEEEDDDEDANEDEDEDLDDDDASDKNETEA